MDKLLNWFNQRILFIGVVILLVFIPLYPKFPLFEVPGTYVAIRFEDILVALLVGIFIIKTLLERNNIFQDRLHRLFLIFFLIGGLSSFSAILLTKNVVPHLVLLHWLRRVEYMSLFFIAAASVRRTQDIKDYLIVLFLATVGVVIYGVGQKFLGFPVISTMNEEFSKGILLSLSEWARVNSTFAGHYDLAAFLVLILAITAGSIIGFAKWWQKILVLLFGVGAFYLLILTASQISFAAYLVGVTIVLVFSKKYLWVIPVLSLSILAMATSSDFSKRYAATFKVNLDFLSGIYKSRGKEKLVIAPTPTPPPVPPAKVTPVKAPKKIKVTPTPTPAIPREKRYIQYVSGEPTELIELTAYRSTKIRFNVEWPRALRAFAKNPLLGTGYSSTTLATDNDYLRALGETGILGFLALMFIFLEIARRVARFIFSKEHKFEKIVVIGITGAVLGFLLNALFIDVLEASKVAFIFWLLVGVMIGIINMSTPAKIAKNE